MASVNKVIIVGNLGRDPEVRYTPNGDSITNVTIATTDTWKDKATGEKKEGQERYTTEIVANEMKMLGSREGMSDAPPRESGGGASASSGGGNRPAAAAQPAGSNFNDFEDDIPF